MSAHKFRCGDTARIDGADFDIEVAFADENGYASWCGWPNGLVETKKLSCVKACSDDEHRKAVARWLDGKRDQDYDSRREAIERLYRPRAYWRRKLNAANQRAEMELASAMDCEAAFNAACAGPADVEPLPAPAPVEGATTS